MKLLLIFLVTIYATQALTNFSKAVLSEKWENFKRANAKTFRSLQEETLRRSLFEQRLQKVEEHNERYRQGLETYEIGINQLSDLTDDELKTYTHGFAIPSNFTPASQYSFAIRPAAFATVPGILDWRSRGIITPVKNQKSCVSGWAFATTGALEAHYRLYSGLKVSLSEQQLVDCATAAGGCSGGFIPAAYEYIARNGGIAHDSYYSYQANKYTCRYSKNYPQVSIRGYTYLPNSNENTLKNLVAVHGPVAVAIDASGNFGAYSGGVYYNPYCSSTNANHAVVVVGYGRESGQDYWLVKNSFGPAWGQSGYIKMARNRDNNCGIASHPSFPIF